MTVIPGCTVFAGSSCPGREGCAIAGCDRWQGIGFPYAAPWVDPAPGEATPA